MGTYSLVRVTQRLLHKSSPSTAVFLLPRQASAGRRQDYHHRQQEQDGGQGRGRLAAVATTAAVTAAIAYNAMDEERLNVMADEYDMRTVLFENRIRQYYPPDQLFNYFATYQVESNVGGRKQTVMMSPMDLFNAITPESPGHDDAGDGAAGAGNYISVAEEEMKNLEMKQSPLENSILNEIGKCGLLTYNDFCFLLTFLSTPSRYIETAYKMYDITGDGNIEAKEFAHMCSKFAPNAGGFGNYQNRSVAHLNLDETLNLNSGLLNYLFGKDHSKSVDMNTFLKFIKDIQDELIELEFREYDRGNTGRISEEDLAKFILKYANIPPKQKKKIIHRVKKEWPSKKRGVSLPSFKNLYHTLASGDDLERAVSFMDHGDGISYEDLRRVSSWVSTGDMSDHVARVLFVVLDDDQNGRLSWGELASVFFTWKRARGYEKLSVNVAIGPKIPHTQAKK